MNSRQVRKRRHANRKVRKAAKARYVELIATKIDPAKLSGWHDIDDAYNEWMAGMAKLTSTLADLATPNEATINVRTATEASGMTERAIVDVTENAILSSLLMLRPS